MGVKISLFLVLFATIGINVFFIVETTKKLNLQTTADYPTGNDNPTGTGDGGYGEHHRGGGEHNHFYNNELIPPTANSWFESGMKGLEEDSEKNEGDPKHPPRSPAFSDMKNDDAQQKLNMNANPAPQRPNQLKLQEFTKPKSISIDVLSSKSKVYINIDGTTVSTYKYFIMLRNTTFSFHVIYPNNINPRIVQYSKNCTIMLQFTAKSI